MAACSQAPPGPQRIAVLRFDNLTGDASWDWLQDAAQRILSAEFEGGRILPIAASTQSEANLARAGRLLHGYFDRRAGGLHFEVEIEDTARNKMSAIASGQGEPIAALSAIAKNLDPTAQPFSTTDNQAVMAWSQGDDAAAVERDPDFGPAWLDWARKLAGQGDAEDALATASRALARPGLKSPIDRAQIEIVAATLRRDDAARASALEALSKLVPSDPAPLLSLGGVDLNRRKFPDAARAYSSAVQADPANPASQNMLGYAQALAGNLDAARQAFEQYGRTPEDAVNALDSLGEAYFLNGKFAQAEQQFVQAFSKNPAFLDGGTMWKAAHAHWLAGDLPGADRLMDRYWQNRSAAKDPLLAWRKSVWFYETGRRQQAVMLLEQGAASADLSRRQLAVWANPGAVPADVPQLEALYQQSDPLRDGLVRTFYAAALLRAGEREQARQLLARWPLPELDENALASLMYPEFLRLRQQLQ